METKKSPKADLDSKKLTFTLIGLVVALLAVLGVFEYRSYEKKNVDLFMKTVDVIPEDIIPVTKQEQPKPEVVMPKPQLADIKVTDNGDETADDVDINAEISQGEPIKDIIYVQPKIEEEVLNEEEIIVFAEDMPEFPGGTAKLLNYIHDNMKYPMMARESDIQGKVYVQFVVEKDGSVSNAEILRGIGGGCDEEALRVVQSMPKWKPGKQRGNPVRVMYRLPIVFKLQ